MNKDILKRIELDKTDVVLYGAGKYGRIALHNIKMRYPQINIRYFVDDDLKRNNRNIEDVRVVSLDQAVDALGRNIMVIISNYYLNSTLCKIEKTGIDLSRVFFSNELLIEYIDASYIGMNRERISQVYDFLEDYESKIIYKTMIECRINYNIDVLSRTCHGVQYFPEDIFQLGDKEVFIDGGAFDGDTIDAFRKAVNDKFEYIYAFEPDIQNFSKLAQNHKKENIKLFNIGLYNENKNICFSASKGGSSAIEENGEDEIRICAFDQLQVPNKNVSFIKMDIEGSELSALHGMKNTICKNSPKLAICIYHKFEDLWEIPLFIKQIDPKYKLYIRNYTTYLDEVVLYAKVE